MEGVKEQLDLEGWSSKTQKSTAQSRHVPQSTRRRKGIGYVTTITSKK